MGETPILELFAKFLVDSSEIDNSINDAKGKFNNFASFLGGVGKATAATFAAVTTAVTAVTGAVAKETMGLAQYGDNIDKMSQKIGISAQAYQEWDAVLQHSGASIDSLQPAMKTLASAAQTGSDAFTKLGLSQEQVASMSNEDLFSAVVTGLQNMEEGTERTYIASQLLGRGATELGALFNTSAEDTQAMKDRVHELGSVMSNESVKAAAKFQDSLQDLKTGFSGLKRNLVADFLPAITGVMDGLTNIFAGDYDTGLAQMKEGINSFIEGLTEKLPKILEIGGNLIGIIGQSLIDNMPKLLEIGMNIIYELINSLVEALPELLPTVIDIILGLVDMLTSEEALTNLIEAAIQIIMALAMGLIEALPRLTKSVVDIILNIVKAIINNLPLLIESGIQLIYSLMTGIVGMVPELLRLFIEMGADIVDSLRNIDWLDLGKNIILGIVNGIKSLASAIGDALMNIVKGAWNSVKKFFGIKSPSRLMRDTIGKFIPLGMAEGIEDEADSVYDAMDKLSKGTLGSVDDIFGNIGSPNLSGGGRNVNYGGLVFNIYGAEGQSVDDIAEAVKEIIVNEEERNKLVYA